MANKFARGAHAIAECDLCGFRYKLSELRPLVVKGVVTNILACPTDWDPDHPQLMLGLFPVQDPMAIRNPRPDSAGYFEQGSDGTGGSRMTHWGFNPVGGPDWGSPQFGLPVLTTNTLICKSFINSVTVTTT
jgi:hypothetical protein